MCGICGLHTKYRSDFDQLNKACRLLIHRGPDDSGIYFNDPMTIGLAHTRLSIQDTSNLGHQPMCSDSGDVVLVFNGEIYNFKELRVLLEDNGYELKGMSDTEVLLNMYLEYGETMLKKLNGIFAFAIWDVRERSLFLARDAMGVKPLYYIESEDGFYFSSEIKSLVTFIPDCKDLDLQSINRYLSFLWCPGEGTPIKGVKKLIPGEALRIKAGRIDARWQWFKLPRAPAQVSTIKRGDLIDGVREHLQQSVQRQLVSDVPVGAFLSGGLDSSAIVAMASKYQPRINCFTIEHSNGADDGVVNDLPYAKRVADYLKVPLEIVRIDAEHMAQDLRSMITHLDEPLADPAPLNVLYISRLARRNGIKILLSGVGGDDLFAGYRRHRAIMSERYWQWLPRPILKGMENLSANLKQDHVFVRRLGKLFNGADLKGDARLVNYFAWSKRADLQALYSSEFRHTLNNSDAFEPMLDFLGDFPVTASPLQRMLALEQRFFLADHNLIYTDKMSMAAGVEVRVPFLDPDMVSFAAKIPDKLKLWRGNGKWILKKALEPYLPQEVIYRSKSGFGAPLRRWMRFELRDLLGDTLGEDSLRRRGIFDYAAVQRLILANDKGEQDATYTLFSLMCVELWCREFIDNSVVT